MRRARAVVAVITCVMLHAVGRVGAQQVGSPALAIAEAVPDAASRTLTITGQNFGLRPLVTLDLIPLTIQIAIDTHIVATAPFDVMPAGRYLLTVSRGASTAESATIELTLGADPPQAASSAQDVVLTPFTSGDNAAARVGDRAISLADVDLEWRRTDPASYVGISRQIYDMRRRIVDRMVADELLAREAAARGLTKEALLEQEVPKRIVTLPDSAVASLYQSLGDNTRGASLEQMRPALRAWLERNTQPELARMNYLEELTKTSTRAEVLLAAPRMKVERGAQDPSLGPATAPVEIVAFGDFQSGEYARFAQAFAKVRETFGDRVGFVFKHLPSLGPESGIVAEAAHCAHAQGKFWPYHDALVATPRAVTRDGLKQLAREVGADAPKFDACFDGGQFRAQIPVALKEAERYAIPGSPSFLVNGRLAPAAPPFLPAFEFFTRIIEEELAGQRARN